MNTPPLIFRFFSFASFSKKSYQSILSFQSSSIWIFWQFENCLVDSFPAYSQTWSANDFFILNIGNLNHIFWKPFFLSSFYFLSFMLFTSFSSPFIPLSSCLDGEWWWCHTYYVIRKEGSWKLFTVEMKWRENITFFIKFQEPYMCNTHSLKGVERGGKRYQRGKGRGVLFTLRKH